MRIVCPGSRGAALVEFAIASVLLIMLVFGVIEFGLMIKDYLGLNQAAREGARSAALGSPVATIESRVRDSAAVLAAEQVAINLSYRVYDKSAGAWGPWAALTDDTATGNNSAPPGSQVRVTLSYPHQLVAGSLFSQVAGAGTTKMLGCGVVAGRE